MGTESRMTIGAQKAEVQVQEPLGDGYVLPVDAAELKMIPTVVVRGATGVPASIENVRGLLPGLGSGLAGSIGSQHLHWSRIDPAASLRKFGGLSPTHSGLVGSLQGVQAVPEQVRYVVDQFDPSVLYLGWHAMEQIEVLPRRPWLPVVLTRLEELRSLAFGWDSPTSLPVREDMVQRALAFLWQVMQEITPPPSIVPLGSGGLQIEWHRAGWNVEIEFDDDTTTPIYVHELATDEEQEAPNAPVLFEELELSYRLAAGYDPANGSPR
jgi:hypothetical protein